MENNNNSSMNTVLIVVLLVIVVGAVVWFFAGRGMPAEDTDGLDVDVNLPEGPGDAGTGEGQ